MKYINIFVLLLFVQILGIIYLPDTSASYSSSCQFYPADDEGPAMSGLSLVDGYSFTREYIDSVLVFVIDEDGIDQVWCYYGVNGSEGFTNVSMSHSHGDSYGCVISGYLDSYETTFLFQFCANDTIGFRSTYNQSYHVYYIEPDTTEPTWQYIAPIIIISSIGIVALVAVGWWYKKRR